MRTVLEYVEGRANVSPEARALAEKVNELFYREFPNGWIQFRPECLGLKGFNLYFGLIGNRDDLPSRILMNDPLYHSMGVSEIPGGYEVEASSCRLMVNPEPGSYMAMGSIKTGFRKFKGDEAKIVAGFAKYFAKVKELVKANQADVYGRNSYDDKYFE